MIIVPRRINSVPIRLFAIFACFLISASCPSVSPTSINVYSQFELTEFVPPTNESGESNRDILGLSKGPKNRVIIQYLRKDKSGKEIGHFFRISENKGQEFGEEREVPKSLSSDVKRTILFLTPTGVGAIAFNNGNIYYTHSTTQSWTELVRINDEDGVRPASISIATGTDGTIYCSWPDERSGASQIYISSSNDSGKTWSADKTIESDVHKSDRERPQLFLGANERLLLFWLDWRDDKTLADIRFSYSDDRGKTWTPSRKINDDGKSVWQIQHTAVVDGENILVAFADFREKYGDDNDWNIYYTRSLDNGETWEKNRRLNDIRKGRQGKPRLAVGREGRVYSAWHTTEKTLFGQVAFSYSNNFGETWSPSIKLTDPNKMVSGGMTSLASVEENKILLSWVYQTYGSSKRQFFYLRESGKPILHTEPSAEEPKPPNIPKYRKVKTEFEDSFSSANTDRWRVESGVWNNRAGTYMGVRPDESKSFMSFAKTREPDRYVLNGKFKLDATYHFNADIYFRANAKTRRYYVIKNRFRHGSWLSEKNNDLAYDLHFSGGKPLAQSAFSLRADRWYEFRLVVMPDRVIYYVDGRLIIDHSEKLSLPPGEIGLGGFAGAPVYFDDVEISKVE